MAMHPGIGIHAQSTSFYNRIFQFKNSLLANTIDGLLTTRSGGVLFNIFE